MLIHYVKFMGRRVGVVVALDKDMVGWSQCNPIDVFNKEIGLKIAIGRAMYRTATEPHRIKYFERIFSEQPCPQGQHFFCRNTSDTVLREKEYKISQSFVMEDAIKDMWKRAKRYFKISPQEWQKKSKSQEKKGFNIQWEKFNNWTKTLPQWTPNIKVDEDPPVQTENTYPVCKCNCSISPRTETIHINHKTGTVVDDVLDNIKQGTPHYNHHKPMQTILKSGVNNMGQIRKEYPPCPYPWIVVSVKKYKYYGCQTRSAARQIWNSLKQYLE